MGILKTFFAKEKDSYVLGKERIAKCKHCCQITKQKNDVVLLQNPDNWVCTNCGTYSHISPCTCGCTPPHYPSTGLTEKDIIN